jgi:uncharacterized membrane protein
MNTTYNQIAGRSIERLAALSDGIFGVAMTLLLLQLNVPDLGNNATESALVRAICGQVPALLVYLMSFITLGIFWVGQQSQLNNLKGSDRHLTWANLAFLFVVTILPFSTRLLITYITLRTALLIYWGNILMLGVLVYACWVYAERAELVKDEISKEVRSAIAKRILIAQTLYAGGAALCVFSTYISIAVIVLIQLNYAIAPRYRRAR